MFNNVLKVTDFLFIIKSIILLTIKLWPVARTRLRGGAKGAIA